MDMVCQYSSICVRPVNHATNFNMLSKTSPDCVRLGRNSRAFHAVCFGGLDCAVSVFTLFTHFCVQQDAEKYAELKKKRTFKKFTYRGIELEGLLDLRNDELAQLVPARARRRFSRGMLHLLVTSRVRTASLWNRQLHNCPSRGGSCPYHVSADRLAGLKRKPMALIKKLRNAKKDCSVGEKPPTVKTHLRNMIIMPEMIGSVVGVYNGKIFVTVEIKV